jgi:DNA-binding transcriptional LysR family regulator
VDSNRLRYFCTVARTVHVHRAAELLGISPAALSKSVKQLELEVGVRLVGQSGRGIVITEQGKAFARQAEVLLADWEGLRSSLQRQAEARERLRIGSFEVFTTHFLGDLLRTEFADTELTLHELGPGQLELSIAADTVDIGLTYLPIPHADLDFLKITMIEMGVYGKQSLWKDRDFRDIPFVVPVAPLQGTPNKVTGLDGWPDNLVPRRIQYRVTLMESALEICRQGLALAYLPDFVVRLHNAKHQSAYQLDAFGDRSPVPARYHHQAVYLIKRKGDPESRALRRLAKAVRRICQAG